jgi:hypothetical protein
MATKLLSFHEVFSTRVALIAALGWVSVLQLIFLLRVPNFLL